MKLKKCVTCLQEKPLSEFNKQATQKDGHAFYCKSCNKIRKKAEYERGKKYILAKIKEKRWNDIEKTRADGRASYQRNKEQRRLDGIRWRAENAEEISIRNKKKYAENPEPHKQRAKRQRDADPDLMRERGRASYRRNKPAYLARARKREIELTNATPPWVDMREIAKFYVEAARLTLETGIPHEVDHIYPLKGKTSCGLHVPWNLQILTRKKNRAKSNKIVPEFHPEIA